MVVIMIIKIIANIYKMCITCLPYVSFHEIHTHLYLLFYPILICEVIKAQRDQIT